MDAHKFLTAIKELVKQYWRLLLLFSLFPLSMAFEFFSNSSEDDRNWWIAGNSSNLTLTPAWYVFILTYHIIVILQQIVIVSIGGKFRNEYLIICMLLVISCFDYVIGNNDVYGVAKIDIEALGFLNPKLRIPISMNIICTLVSGFFIGARIYSDGLWRNK